MGKYTSHTQIIYSKMLELGYKTFNECTVWTISNDPKTLVGVKVFLNGSPNTKAQRDWVGNMLIRYYKTQEEVRKIVELGHILSLGRTTEHTHIGGTTSLARDLQAFKVQQYTVTFEQDVATYTARQIQRRIEHEYPELYMFWAYANIKDKLLMFPPCATGKDRVVRVPDLKCLHARYMCNKAAQLMRLHKDAQLYESERGDFFIIYTDENGKEFIQDTAKHTFSKEDIDLFGGETYPILCSWNEISKDKYKVTQNIVSLLIHNFVLGDTAYTPKLEKGGLK